MQICQHFNFNSSFPCLYTTLIQKVFDLQQEDICSLKEAKEKGKNEELAVLVKGPRRASRARKMQLVREREKGKQMMAGNENAVASEHGLRICKPQGTFLHPNIYSSGSFSANSMSSATLSPHQLVLLPSPTSPLPLHPAFLWQSGQNQIQTQVHSAVILAQSEPLGRTNQTSFTYASPVCYQLTQTLFSFKRLTFCQFVISLVEKINASFF